MSLSYEWIPSLSISVIDWHKMQVIFWMNIQWHIGQNVFILNGIQNTQNIQLNLPLIHRQNGSFSSVIVPKVCQVKVLPPVIRCFMALYWNFATFLWLHHSFPALLSKLNYLDYFMPFVCPIMQFCNSQDYTTAVSLSTSSQLFSSLFSLKVMSLFSLSPFKLLVLTSQPDQWPLWNQVDWQRQDVLKIISPVEEEVGFAQWDLTTELDGSQFPCLPLLPAGCL